MQIEGRRGVLHTLVVSNGFFYTYMYMCIYMYICAHIYMYLLVTQASFPRFKTVHVYKYIHTYLILVFMYIFVHTLFSDVYVCMYDFADLEGHH